MSVSQPGAGQQGLTPAQRAAAAGAAGTAAAAAAAPPAAAAGLATAAGIGATAIVASLLSFLTLLREADRRWLLGNLGRYSRVPGDIAQVIEDEMRLEEAFAQASSDRLAAGLPAALQIADPAERAAALRRLLEAEERYAQQRQEAMAARAIAAVTRAQLRRDSPLGAFWRLGRAKDHTPGCIVMAGGDYEGAGKFWPWAVIDRVHPPRHYGCTSTLHSFGEAVREGWMGPGDVPDTRAAIRAAAGVLMEEWEAEALERELELREGLVEAGLVGWDQLASRPWEGVAEAFDDVLHPRDWRGRFRDKPGWKWSRMEQEKTFGLHFSSYGDAVPGGYNGGYIATDPATGKEVGRLEYQSGGGESQIAWIHVEPAARRQGVGSKLVTWAEHYDTGEREPLDAGMMTPDGAALKAALEREHRAQSAAAALKRGEPATVEPKDAPALIEALNDGELSSLHLLQVTGHPNLFRTHARDLTRAEMPQIRKADLPGFMDFLRQHRVGAVLEPRRPSELRATQNQINGAAVAALARGWDPTRGNVIMVSQEGDILDGHHRWAAAALDEMSHPERRMDTLRFSAGTDRILALMREYNELAGIESRPFARGSVPAGGVR